MTAAQLKPDLILRGPLFPEPVQVITTVAFGASLKLVARGLQTNQVYQPILTEDQIECLQANPEREPFDGEAAKFRLGIESLRLGLAYEYDPYFSLSIARVDPLPQAHGKNLQCAWRRLSCQPARKDGPRHVCTEPDRGRDQSPDRRAGRPSSVPGAVFFDLHARAPSRLDVFSASIRDGRGNVLNKRLFVVQALSDGTLAVRQPTIFLDLTPAPSPLPAPPDQGMPDRSQTELCLLQQALEPMLVEARSQREREIAIISRHVQISLTEIMNRENLILADLISQKEAGSSEAGLDGRIKISEDKLLEADHRMQSRTKELEQERQCNITDIHQIGQA